MFAPKNGFWAPSGDGYGEKDYFGSNTEIFPCLITNKTHGDDACLANFTFADAQNGFISVPSTAYKCRDGHRGVLCAACQDNYFFSKGKCKKCDDTGLETGVTVALVLIALALITFAGMKCIGKRKLAALNRTLHQERKSVRRRRRHVLRRQRKRRQRNRRRKRRKRKKRKEGVSGQSDDDDGDGETKDRITAVVLRARSLTISAAHRVVVSVREGRVDLGETARILFNFSKVNHYLTKTLVYCVVEPKALRNIKALFSVFALDLIGSAKIPCFYTEFTYFDRLNLVLVAPLVMVVVILIFSWVWTVWTGKGQKWSTAVKKVFHRSDRAQFENNMFSGMLHGLNYSMQFLDLIYPAVTITLCRFWTCRDLGAAGEWLARQNVC